MYEYTCDGIRIVIRPERGIFAFPRRSGIGKTYFGTLLNRLRNIHRVRMYTYDDYRDGISLSDILRSEKYDVLYLDRSDRYYEEFIPELLIFSKRHLLLLDAKYITPECPIGKAILSYRKDIIEVIASVIPICGR